MHFIFALIALCSQPQEQATLRGVVTDVTGGAVSNTSIRVLQSDSHLVAAHAISGKDGSFETGPMMPGLYTITANAPGFRFRIWPGVAVREGEIHDLGKLQIELGRCETPGMMCDTFGIAPLFPGLIRQQELAVGLHCGADLVKGTISCPADAKADFTVANDGAGTYIEPVNGSALYVPNSSVDGCTDRVRSEARVRIDGFGPGFDFCLRRRDDRVSHIYVTSEVSADSADVRFWFMTTKRLRK